VILDLSDETHGNAQGIGLADVTTRRLYEKMRFEMTYPTGVTNTFLHLMKIPMVMDNDREALQLALCCCPEAEDQENKKLMDQLIAISKMTPAVPSEPKKQPVKKEETPEYSKTYEWTVESGQTLSSIVQTINNSGGKTSVNAILKANKGLKAETLRVGQKIIIPDIGSK